MTTRMNRILDDLDDAQIEYRTADRLFKGAVTGTATMFLLTALLVTAIVIIGEQWVVGIVPAVGLGGLAMICTAESWSRRQRAARALRITRRRHRDALDEVHR